MIRMSIDTAKSQLEELIEAALRGEEVLITTNGDGPPRVVRLTVERVEAGEQRKPEFGSGRGTFWMSDDFDEPLEDFEEYMR